MKRRTLPSERCPHSWGAYYIMDMPAGAERERLRLAHLAHQDAKEGAYQTYRDALKDGRLVRAKSCDECGQAGRIVGHHPDYSRPLSVQWLCCKCHCRAHAADRARAIAHRARTYANA